MDYRAKVSLIGDEKTGKTSIILRYIKNTFSNEYMTTLGADFIDKTYTSENNVDGLDSNDELTLTIWDMAGQSHFKEIAKIYCEGSAGIIIVFDVNDQDSFDSLPEWIEYAKNVAPNAQLMIVGNKVDLPMEIDEGKIRKMEKKFDNIPIEYTSAKVGLNNELSNLKNVFERMASMIVQSHNQEDQDNDD